MKNNSTSYNNKTKEHEKLESGPKVFLVGAGPGDPGLITLKAKEVLQEAETVVYDHLANKTILQYCKKECIQIYAGKKQGDHTMAQAEINRLLIEHGLAGRKVVRLKGGDPFVFGRGGEEALALVKAGLSYEVIPGITAAVAAAAYAGIPLTHREISSSVVLVTGHEAPDKEAAEVNWRQLARGADTIAVYMGVKNLNAITQKLIQAGLSSTLPAAIIEQGTLVKQKCTTATLSTISIKAENENIKPPAILVIGDVVKLREQLTWFENKPLFSKRVLVTRSRDQASQLIHQLHLLGAETAEFPSILISACSDKHQLDKIDQALECLDTYSWIMFTSINGVKYFFHFLQAKGKDTRALARANIGAIGEPTAEALLNYGLKADFVPARFTSQEMVQELKQAANNAPFTFSGKRVLLPGSTISGPELPAGLKELGAEIEMIPVYRTERPAYSRQELIDQFIDPWDLITFTSSSTVNNLVEMLVEHNMKDIIPQLKGVSIGPVTTGTAEAHGIQIIAEAEPHTIPGIITAITRHIRETKQRERIK